MTDLDAVPSKVLNFIRCKYKIIFEEAMWHEALLMQEKRLEMCDGVSRVSRSDLQQRRPRGK